MSEYIWKKTICKFPFTGTTTEYKLCKITKAGNVREIGAITHKKSWGTFDARFFKDMSIRYFNELSDAKLWLEHMAGVKNSKVYTDPCTYRVVVS